MAPDLHSTHSSNASTARPLRLLVATGDDELRDHLSALLVRSGYDVWEARDVQEIVDWMGTSRDLGFMAPDVLVLDDRMSHPGGVGLLSELRRAGWRLPIVLMTAGVDGIVTHAALVWGVAAVPARPSPSDPVAVKFDPDGLRARASSRGAAGFEAQS